MQVNASPESLGRNEKSIWEYYNEMAAVEDNIREVEWRDLADTILVFVCMNTLYDIELLTWLQDGLFAAFLSAFLVFTIPRLQPNSTDIALDALVHISQQLSNSTTPAYVPSEFAVSPSIAVVNILFFLSLALVLIDAFLAMLVKSWIQEFDRGWRKYTVAHLRAQEREWRLQALERWKLVELVALLPILIQTSLLFFCIGLIVLLFPIHLVSAIAFSLAPVAGLSFYIFTTYVSTLDIYAPFSSPVSRGFTILINALQTWFPLVIQNSQSIISAISPHTSHPEEHHIATNSPTVSLPGSNEVTHPSLHQGEKGIEKKEAVIPSRGRVHPQTYVDILERLVMTTAEAVENIPIFLDLLNQPVNDPTLRPSNIRKWKQLLHTTLRLLGDPSTFSDSVARIIARNVLFCYDGGTADCRLSQTLKYCFDHMSSGQMGKHKPLNSLFAHFLGSYSGSVPIAPITVSSTIAYLEPSHAADVELLWIVNIVHRLMFWTQLIDQSHVCYQSIEFFAAVLTYVSSSEQSRRSQVPLTAAVIYAMHSIKSALDKGHINSIQGPYILQGNIVSTSESMSMTLHQVDALDLWSDNCVELASTLLQPHTHWLGFSANDVWKFQLALIAALYIDSTKQAGHASTTFARLLGLTNIPNITEDTWEWADAYNQTQLAGYWYMALFQEPLYQKNAPFQDVGYVIMETIQHLSEPRLSALHLLDISAKHLCATASSSSILFKFGYLELTCTLPSGAITHNAHEPFDPWILFHLDTLFPKSSVLHLEELEKLEWADTPEQVHIAKARLALYDSLKREEYIETKQLSPGSQVLKLFLWSTNYAVCTGAFKMCLNLVAMGRPTADGDAHHAEVLNPETMKYEWIEHLIQVLFGHPDDGDVRSWEFLAEHLIPKWTMLPSSWCSGFAFAFLFSNVPPNSVHELPAYQCLAEALRGGIRHRQIDQLQWFLLFLANLLELVKLRFTWDQLVSFENWLAHLPEILGNHDAHAQMENILATRRQQLVGETLRFFAELPMVHSGTEE